jgi:flavorubredoxin
MTARLDEIAADVFRASVFDAKLGFTFNQYLIRDEQPLLYHTGFRSSFEVTWEAVAKVIDPRSIRWIGYSHFEADECGALNRWLARAPRATPIAGDIGAGINLADLADRPAKVLQDDELLTTGSRRFRFLATPHLPHGWDASLLFETTNQALFCSDLFLHSGDGPAIVEADIVGPAREMLVASQAGPFHHNLPWTSRTEAMFQRLGDLRPQVLAVMHGSAYRGDGARALFQLCEAVREIGGTT